MKGKEDSWLPEVTDEVLLELGRLVFAALYLEDAAAAVCHAVTGDSAGATSRAIEARIQEALTALGGWPLSAERDAGIGWLESAREALDRRPGLMRAARAQIRVPVGLPRLAGVVGPPSLVPPPARGNHTQPDIPLPSPYSRSAPSDGFTGEAQHLQQAFTAALEDWSTIGLNLHKARKRQWALGFGEATS